MKAFEVSDVLRLLSDKMDKLFLKEDDLQRAIQQHMKKRLSKINSTNKHDTQSDLPKLGIHGPSSDDKNFEPIEIIIMHSLLMIR